MAEGVSRMEPVAAPEIDVMGKRALAVIIDGIIIAVLYTVIATVVALCRWHSPRARG